MYILYTGFATLPPVFTHAVLPWPLHQTVPPALIPEGWDEVLQVNVPGLRWQTTDSSSLHHTTHLPPAEILAPLSPPCRFVRFPSATWLNPPTVQHMERPSSWGTPCRANTAARGAQRLGKQLLSFPLRAHFPCRGTDKRREDPCSLPRHY